jgi:dipeptide/tripeptide permease
MISGLVMYTCGLALITVAALPALGKPYPGNPTPMAWGFLAVGIALLSMGYGFFKTVSAPIVADALDNAHVPCSRRSRAFQLYSWVVNIGALGGTLITPFARSLSSETATDPEDDTRSISSAFYLSFGMCAIAALCGVVLVSVMYSRISRVASPRPDRKPLHTELFNLFCRRDAAYQKTMQACRVFAVLPFFWLVQNQFMSNVMFQLQWSTLPSSLPPEFFNNINTITMLVSIAVLRGVFVQWGVVPSQRSRMLAGFAIVAAAIIWCMLVQLSIEERGFFTTDQDYVIRQGRTAVSAWLLVPPYAASGVASALIDPTTLEAAFERAPGAHKSLVMSLYLLAASMSGWLGIAFAPLATPQTLKVMYGAMCTILSTSALAWSAMPIKDFDACDAPDFDDGSDGSGSLPLTHSEATERL